MECELLRSPMISYRSLLYNTTVLYDNTTVLYDKFITLPLMDYIIKFGIIFTASVFTFFQARSSTRLLD